MGGIMLSNTDVLQKMLGLLESGYIKAAGACVSPDFEFSGFTREPLSADAFLDLFGRLVSAMPDWEFNIHDQREQGDRVHVTLRITATHIQPLDLTSRGRSPIPPTGVRVILPKHEVKAEVRDGLVRRLDLAAGRHNDFDELLRQIGVETREPVGA